MYLSEWLSSTSGVKVLFGKRDTLTHKAVVHISRNIPPEKQALVIDVKRQWQANRIGSRTKIIYVNKKEELVKSIFDLPSMLSPRLFLVIIDGLPYYFRDFLGKELRKGIINTRSYAACLILLNRLVERGVHVIVTSYSQSLNETLPIMYEASTYYTSNIFRVESLVKDEISLQTIDGEIVVVESS